MISLDSYYALLVLYVRMKCIPCWGNVLKKVMITFARATVLPRYTDTILFCFVSVPLQIEKFAKVRTISISFQYQRNKGGFRTGVPKTTFPWKKPGEPSPKTKNKTRLCKGGNRTDPLNHVIMRPPKFSSRNAKSPHLHS